MKPYYTDESVTIYNASSLHMCAIPDSSVQCVVTSPPYWGLRKYDGEQDSVWGGDSECEHEWETLTRKVENNSGLCGSTLTSGASPEKRQQWHDGKSGATSTGTCLKCGAWRGAFGLEPTPELYVEHTVLFLREIWRVLRDDGCVFWNVGDSYAASKMGSCGSASTLEGGKTTQCVAVDRIDKSGNGLKPKDMCLIPFRVALAAQADGWYVRSDIVWAKPNPMPESVRDRPTSSYEHIFLFTKSPRYYWDQDAVREDSADWNSAKGFSNEGQSARNTEGRLGAREDKVQSGRNLRDVWTIATQPSGFKHYASFPEKIPETCIKAATKVGDLVLDPFAGTGRTLEVALKLGRKAVGYELSEKYCGMARQRCQQGVIL